MIIPQNNSTIPLPFLMTLNTDHITGATGRTPTVTIRNALGAFLPPNGAVSETGGGWYSLSPAPADASVPGPLILHAVANGCDPSDTTFFVQPTPPPCSCGCD